MTHPTPTASRAVTLYLNNPAGEAIGSFAARLVPHPTGNTSGTHAITHGLGSIAGGTHTEVSFADGTAGSRDLDGDGSFRDPQREALREEVVRAVANALYSRSWAFQYRPEQVPDSVLAHGSILRERVEVSAVELWRA